MLEDGNTLLLRHSQDSSSCVRKRPAEEIDSGYLSICTNLFLPSIIPCVTFEGNSHSAFNFLGFHTAGLKREIKVSEEALKQARTCLSSALEADSDERRKIAVSVSDAENRDPSEPYMMCTTSGIKTVPNSLTRSAFQSAFVSPVIRNSTRLVYMKPAPTISGTDVVCLTNRYSKDCCTSSMSPNASIQLISNDKNAVARKEVRVLLRTRPLVSPVSVTCELVDHLQLVSLIFEVPGEYHLSFTAILLPSDFLAIIVGNTASYPNSVHGTQLLKVADRYGESITIEVLSRSISSDITPGVVISIDDALLKCTEEEMRLIVNETSFVELEPSDPEAECLHRLFSTGLFDNDVSEDAFTFDHSKLRVIGRLSEYPGEVSSIMARICTIDSESIVYLGKARYFYSLSVSSKPPPYMETTILPLARSALIFQMELADFSGIIAVKVTDNAAEKLIGKPAGGMVKLEKAIIQKRLSSLYFRPMLFRISEKESMWIVDAWKQLDICKFVPFLRNVAKQKGYK
ncbi:hypothetical protein DICVIV_03354 [Dictyocaulus viviparus]|uniref:Uncharacterized protein n=1 Tax=Dictyocaulus viviparus TaxID=29172 RepID=A0A0D8Y3A3_DICVI|nr:hypothetical protein DICVIV_03354 [Dictyocaulus viviparus]